MFRTKISGKNRVCFIIVFVLFFSGTAGATDIATFDIKGLKPGMDMAQVSKILNIPCSYGALTVKNIPYAYVNKCGNYVESPIFQSNKKYREWELEFDHNKKLYRIIRTVSFSVSPDFTSLKTRIKDKYGEPTLITSAESKNQTSFAYKDFDYFGMCWDGCKKDEVLTPGFTGEFTEILKDKSHLYIYPKASPQYKNYYLVFDLYLNGPQQASKAWAEGELKKQTMQTKKSESNIEL